MSTKITTKKTTLFIIGVITIFIILLFVSILSGKVDLVFGIIGSLFKGFSP